MPEGWVDAVRPSRDREGLTTSAIGDALESELDCALLGRSRREGFAFAPGFDLGLGFGRLLYFFSAFIFASHK